MNTDSEKTARDEGMAYAERGAGEEWNALAREEILRVARERAPGTFTANDVRERLPTPRQRKSMGAQFAALSRAGLIVPVSIAFNNIQGGHRAKLWAWKLADDPR